jgi:hypothetical protein
VIVATSYEIAREAAQRTRVEYDDEPPSATFGSIGAEGEGARRATTRTTASAISKRPLQLRIAASRRSKWTPTQHLIGRALWVGSSAASGRRTIAVDIQQIAASQRVSLYAVALEQRVDR